MGVEQRCPKCGSERVQQDRGYQRYDCGTTQSNIRGEVLVFESWRCLFNQLDTLRAAAGEAADLIEDLPHAVRPFNQHTKNLLARLRGESTDTTGGTAK